MPKTLRVALIQDRNRGDAPTNLHPIQPAVAKPPEARAALVLIQDLHNGPY